MAVSERSNTYGYLNAWARRQNVNTWLFNQIDGADMAERGDKPGQFVYVQPEREQIAEGIRVALALAVKQLRFYPRPVYLHERIRIPHGYPIMTRHCYVDAIGKRGVSLVDDGVTVTYSDADGDGVNETATITVSTDVTEPDELQVFFRRADSLSTIDADEKWQIEPLQVSISGGTATITGHRALFAKPSLWRKPYTAPNYSDAAKNMGSVANAADFVTTVDVYRIYPDATGAATLLSNPYRDSPSTSPTTWTETGAEAVVEDSDLGFISARVAPDALDVGGYKYLDLYYRAGYPLDADGRPNRELETAIIRLANAEMSGAPTGHNITNNFYELDAQAFPRGELSPSFVKNPFGVRVGHVAAWRIIDSFRLSTPPGEV